MESTTSTAKYKPGLNPTVFYTSAGFIFLILALALAFPTRAARFFDSLQNGIIDNLGWFYLLSVAIILISLLYIGFSRLGSIKLGPDHATPDYGLVTWFAMLFSAGMGIGLMFYGVSEPVMHFLAPPTAEPATLAAAREAMSVTFFHWGLHAWAIYAIVALILAFFSFRHNLPLSLRSALYPLIGDKIYGKIGDFVDVFAIISTMFGLATSMGVGVSQLNAGLHHLLPFIPENFSTKLIIIAIITALATWSTVSGLDKGIKFLSELNIGLAVLLLFFVLSFGPTVYIFQAFTQNIGNYISGIVQKTFNLYAYNKTEWSIGGWTLLYWGWWISWSPFVGMFIARVSKGRTISEFIAGVMLIPSGFTLVWMTTFGNGAIDQILNKGNSTLADMVSTNVPVALFSFLESLPMSTITSTIALLMVIIFFVTSADSGAMVIDMLASNGYDKNPGYIKAFWSVGCGVVAAVLIGSSDGLKSLQTMTIASALPFIIVLLVAIVGLLKVLKTDMYKQEASMFNAYMPQPAPSGRGGADGWRDRLQNIVDFPSVDKVRKFIDKTVRPALEKVAKEINETTQLEAVVEKTSEDKAKLIIRHYGEVDNFSYEVVNVESVAPALDETMQDQTYHRAEVFLREGGQDYDVMGWSEDAVINDVLNQYHKHMHYLHHIT